MDKKRISLFVIDKYWGFTGTRFIFAKKVVRSESNGWMYKPSILYDPPGLINYRHNYHQSKAEQSNVRLYLYE